MNTTFLDIQNKLEKYNQEHLLKFYDELSDNQKEELICQIKEIDFECLNLLYKNSMVDEPICLDNISPIKYTCKKNIDKYNHDIYEQLGEEIIKKEQLAILTLAGGQGSRLGLKGPKGVYEIDIMGTKKSLFEINFDNIKRAKQKYGVNLFWFIMTSDENDFETREYFKIKNYFNYDKNKIIFFKQDKKPVLDVNGKLVLENKYTIKQASNGNGDVFEALKRNDLIKKMKEKNIKYISFTGIDNILAKPIDSVFLGMMVKQNYKIGCKTIFKEQTLEKEAIFCKINNKPSILGYNYITYEFSNLKDEKGNYLYRDRNILAHLMTIDSIENASKIELEYHRAYKENSYINSYGKYTKSKLYKFEKFIFDAFKQTDDILIMRVEKTKEFAPIKDLKSMNNAIKLYRNYWNLEEI